MNQMHVYYVCRRQSGSKTWRNHRALLLPTTTTTTKNSNNHNAYLDHIQRRPRSLHPLNQGPPSRTPHYTHTSIHTMSTNTLLYTTYIVQCAMQETVPTRDAVNCCPTIALHEFTAIVSIYCYNRLTTCSSNEKYYK